MRIQDPKMIIRVTKITDTRTRWQKSSLSRISPVPVLIFMVWGAVVGALIGGSQ